MRCNDVRERILNYVMGELTGTEVIAMDEHINRCQACMKAVDDYLNEIGLHDFEPESDELFRLMRIPMPSQEQVQAGVDEVLRAIRNLKAGTMAGQPLSCEPISSSRPRQPNALSKNFMAFWAYGLAAVAAIGLILLFWSREARYRALEQQFSALLATVESLKRQNEILMRENDALRRKFKNIPSDHKRAQQFFEQKYKELKKKFAQLRMENEKLKARLSQKKVLSEVFVALCDKSGTVAVKTDGTVLVKGKAILPSSVANLVHEFVTKGSVKPAKSTLIAMTILSNKETESVLRSAYAEGSSKPIPLSPVLTAVRSTRPTLRWAEVPDAEEYVVRVADKNDKVVWEGSAGTQTQVTLPSGLLKRGQVYFWQVEAVVEGQSVLSPAVGFWVLNEKELKELAMAERKFQSSSLILASIYARYGLYDEALSQVEHLAKMNPQNSFVQGLLHNLRRQLGK